MAIHWLLLAVFCLINNIIISSGTPADSHKDGTEAVDNVQRGFTINGESPNSWNIGFSTLTNPTTEGGKCFNLISIKWKGFVNVFKFPCSAGTMETHTSDEDILIADKDTVQSNSIYGKKPNELQVIQEGKCSLRTYTTTNGKTTASSTPITGAKCDAMKKEHLDRMKTWQKWKAETFPPCFPFCNGANPGTSVPQTKPKPSSGANVNYNPGNANPYTTTPNSNSDFYTPNWDYDNGINFPPCFPFCNGTNPGTSVPQPIPKPSSGANVNYNPGNANPYTAAPNSNSGFYNPTWDYDNGINFPP